MELYTWEYEGQPEYGICVNLYFATGKREFRWLNGAITRWEDSISNLRPAKVVDEDAVVIEIDRADRLFLHEVSLQVWRQSMSVNKIYKQLIKQIPHPTPPVTKTYLTTGQFIKVWKSFDDAKIKELSAACDAAWDAAWDSDWFVDWSAARSAPRYADLAVLVKDEITTEQFEILTKPWTSCGLSLFAEDWQDILNPKVTKPKRL